MHNKQSPLRYYILAASVVVFLLVVTGGMLRASESGGACLDWPTCFGRWTPPQGNAFLDYTHRMITALTLLFVLGAAWAARRYAKADGWLRGLVYSTLGILVLQILMGAWIIFTFKQP